MTRVKTLFLIVLPIVFAIAACNLPTALGGQGTPKTVLKVTVSVATEYRTGPGQGYDLVGVLNPGQEAEAVGLSPDGEYLLIRNPANPVVLLWLKKDFATVTGDPVLLQSRPCRRHRPLLAARHRWVAAPLRSGEGPPR